MFDLQIYENVVKLATGFEITASLLTAGIKKFSGKLFIKMVVISRLQTMFY